MIASLTGVVEVMKKGLVPAVMANARIVSLLREGQKLVFGDVEEVAWRLMVLGGFISLDTGYAHDLPADLRREIVAVNEHFVEWCEITHERVTQQGVRDEEYTLYCQLDNELSALAREEDAWTMQGHLNNVVVMLGNESILRRNAAATGAHSGRIAVPGRRLCSSHIRGWRSVEQWSGGTAPLPTSTGMAPFWCMCGRGQSTGREAGVGCSAGGR